MQELNKQRSTKKDDELCVVAVIKKSELQATNTVPIQSLERVATFHPTVSPSLHMQIRCADIKGCIDQGKIGIANLA